MHLDSWKERLPELLGGLMKSEDTFNMDGTRVLWQALPDSGLGRNARNVAFFVSAIGVKEKSIEIKVS